MRTSLTVKQIATALLDFQSTVNAATKDSENPFFKSKYATLESIITTIRDPLSKNGLSFSQFPSGENGLCTILMHTSGEWMRATFRMCPVKNDPQGQGSAITYMRRYALSAVLGIRTEEDDDGNAASNKGATIEVKNRQPERVKVSVGAAASLAAQKKRIIGLLSELGQGAKTKKQYEDAVFDLADLTLEKNNYPLIIDRLTDIVVTRMGEDRNIN